MVALCAVNTPPRGNQTRADSPHLVFFPTHKTLLSQAAFQELV